MDNKDIIGIVGAGLIGRAWTCVFARAGHQVQLWDPDPTLRAQMPELLRAMLLEAGDDPAAAARVTTCDSMEQALNGVALVQESGPEVLEIKRELFARMDAAAAPEVILASSSSALVASQFAVGLAGAGRCIVAHPVNPPHVVPVVELCPSPQTEAWVLPRAEAIYRAAGQVPAVLNREIPGFVLNRLQAVLLAEALRLVGEGVCSVQALDDTMRHGLGRRWTLMGPLETVSLNAPAGVHDYMRRYGPTMGRLADDGAGSEAFSERAAAIVAAAFPETDPQAIRDRTAWRDRELAALDRHLRSRTDSKTDKD